jgi:transcriptional regulator with XRE-family HTH domain
VSDDVVSGSPDQHAGASLGEILAGLRKKAGITGQELGRIAGMSQAKISRIETGSVIPDPEAVQRLATALGASKAVARSLVEQAERSQDRMTDWRLRPASVAGRQSDLARIEAGTRVFRVFQPVAVIGLLQTSEYARAIFATSQALLSKSGREAGAAGVADAVSARIQRQRVLADPRKRFHLLMSEAVLQLRLCPAEHMPAQVERIREVAQQENVSIGIIPLDTQWDFPPQHGFQLLDDHIVLIDLLNTGVRSQGRSDTALYRRLFDTFEAQAVTEIDPILDKYLEIYLDLAKSRSRRS